MPSACVCLHRAPPPPPAACSAARQRHRARRKRVPLLQQRPTTGEARELMGLHRIGAGATTPRKHDDARRTRPCATPTLRWLLSLPGQAACCASSFLGPCFCSYPSPLWGDTVLLLLRKAIWRAHRCTMAIGTGSGRRSSWGLCSSGWGTVGRGTPTP